MEHKDTFEYILCEPQADLMKHVITEYNMIKVMFF